MKFGYLSLAFVACTRHEAPRAESHDAAPPPVEAAPPAREPLGDYPWQIDFDDKIGTVSVPLGAREPRPIMVALHGAGDRPGWACGEWRGITNAYPFLVCPHGVGSAFLAWSSPEDTKARIARAIAKTKAMFGPWIRDGVPIVLVGFSMGAQQAALIAQSDRQTYRRVVLSESAFKPEPVMAFARAWTGERILFSCTTIGCEPTYRNAARTLAARHVPARLNIAGTTEHGIWQKVVDSMSRDWPWVVDGAEGWETYAPAATERSLAGKTETFEAR